MAKNNSYKKLLKAALKAADKRAIKLGKQRRKLVEDLTTAMGRVADLRKKLDAVTTAEGDACDAYCNLHDKLKRIK